MHADDVDYVDKNKTGFSYRPTVPWHRVRQKTREQPRNGTFE